MILYWFCLHKTNILKKSTKYENNFFLSKLLIVLKDCTVSILIFIILSTVMLL